jgi:hypothetical protein
LSFLGASGIALEEDFEKILREEEEAKKAEKGS